MLFTKYVHMLPLITVSGIVCSDVDDPSQKCWEIEAMPQPLGTTWYMYLLLVFDGPVEWDRSYFSTEDEETRLKLKNYSLKKEAKAEM